MANDAPVLATRLPEMIERYANFRNQAHDSPPERVKPRYGSIVSDWRQDAFTIE